MAQTLYYNELTKQLFLGNCNNGTLECVTVAPHVDESTFKINNGCLQVWDSNTETYVTITDAGGLPVDLTGAPGADGITPQLQIVDGLWQVSTDGGSTWTTLGPATGKDGQIATGIRLLSESEITTALTIISRYVGTITRSGLISALVYDSLIKDTSGFRRAVFEMFQSLKLENEIPFIIDGYIFQIYNQSLFSVFDYRAEKLRASLMVENTTYTDSQIASPFALPTIIRKNGLCPGDTIISSSGKTYMLNSDWDSVTEIRTMSTQPEGSIRVLKSPEIKELCDQIITQALVVSTTESTVHLVFKDWIDGKVSSKDEPDYMDTIKAFLTGQNIPNTFIANDFLYVFDVDYRIAALVDLKLSNRIESIEAILNSIDITALTLDYPKI